MSKSLRLSDALFEAASAAGGEFTRSAAQQVEHWARLGRALEERGLPVDTALTLLRGESIVDAKEMWANKRKLQKRDLALAKSGRINPADMHLIPAGMAKTAKILNGPY